jgi:hypothetical protein
MDGTGNGVIHRRLRGSSGGSPRSRMNDFENRIIRDRSGVRPEDEDDDEEEED